MSNYALESAFQTRRNTVYLSQFQKRRLRYMSEKEKMSVLESENQRLKTDNDMLLEIVAQMRVTLNRLILQYISADSKG